MKNFSIELLPDGYYQLMDGKNKITTPHGNLVRTDNKELADKLLEEMNKGFDYTQVEACLTYHYTYCNFDPSYNAQLFAEELVPQLPEYLFHDRFLLLLQTIPLKPAYVNYYSEQMPMWLETLDLYQIVALGVIMQVEGSIVLPYRIDSEIIAPVLFGNVDYKESKAEFIEKLEEFFSEWEGLNNNEAKQAANEYQPIIDTFVYYYTIGHPEAHKLLCNS